MGNGYITQRKIMEKDYLPFKRLVDDSLTEVTAEMLNGATSISDYAFFACANLTSVEIPNTVTTISGYAIFFSGCSSLVSVTVEAYKSATRWSTYASRIQAIPST